MPRKATHERELPVGRHLHPLYTWLMIVYRRSAKDTDASMAGFEKAPAAATFLSEIDTSTFSIRRHRTNRGNRTAQRRIDHRSQP